MKRRMLAVIWLVLAILCIAYGFTVKAAGSGTLFFLVWIALGIIFLLAFAGVQFGLWARLPLALRRTITVAALALCVMTAVFCGLIFSRFHEKGEKNLDYLIVLGAQVYSTGPSRVLKARLDAAAAYLKDNPDTLCIVTGGQGYNEPFPEAQGMAEYLERRGISPDRIIRETESQNTRENIANAMRLVDLTDKSVGIVTNNFHLYRALRIAKGQGLSDCSGIAGGSAPLYLPNNLFRECLALAKEFVLGTR